MEDIVTDIERYRSVVDLLIINKDEELVKEKAKEFNDHLRLFEHFYSSDEEIDPDASSNQDIDSDLLEKDTTILDSNELQ